MSVWQFYSKHSTLLLLSTWHILNNADNKKKIKSFIIQTTYKLPNKSMIKHVNHVASAPQQLLKRHCIRTMCLIQCINYFVNDIILRPFFGRRATHFRLADCRSSGAFLTFEMLYNYEKVRVSSPHSSVETRMPWLDCIVSAQLRISRVVVFHNSTGNEPVNQVLQKYAWNCSIAFLWVLMQWCGKGVNLIRRQKSQGHVGLNMRLKCAATKRFFYDYKIHRVTRRNVQMFWQLTDFFCCTIVLLLLF